MGNSSKKLGSGSASLVALNSSLIVIYLNYGWAFKRMGFIVLYYKSEVGFFGDCLANNVYPKAISYGFEEKEENDL